ncbi:MAG: site-2 protease family protein [Nitrospirae bacterium]|nr:site-2 protease family protein [Nitrospirota bacterium]
MFTSGFKIFRVLGIPIYINYTWFIVFSLVVYTLAVSYFPYLGPYYEPSVRWIMAFIAAILLFSSILLHELSHSYVAQRQGIKIKSITLFVFGGIAQMVGESRSPGGEMKIAAAGPALSLFISGIFWTIVFVFKRGMATSPVLAISYFLAYTNMILAVFNLIPGFPLDGGRMLRAFIWKRSNNLNKATLITSRIGKGFALLLIVGGLWNILQGVFISGLWMIFVGMFLQQAADQGYRQTVLNRTLSSVKIRDIMVSPAIVVNNDVTLDHIVNDFFFRYRYNSFPVVSGDVLAGIISFHDIKLVEKEKWPYTIVQDIMHKEINAFTISPESGALEALDKMIDTHSGRLVVTENGHIAGMISQRDIMHMLKMKADLGTA